MGKFPEHDYSYTIVTTMKDEAPYLLEWIAYHLAIGFTHFVVLTNDCSDGTERILRNLEKRGLVTQKNNPAPHPRGPQKTGYMRMRKLEAIQKADWLLALDCDEFWRIDVGDGHLDDLFAEVYEDVKAISFVWQLFGNNDVEHIENALVMDQFTKAIHSLQSRPYEARPFKTMFHTGYFEKIGTHRPNDFDKSKWHDFEWIDANGVSIKNFTQLRHWHAQPTGLGFGTILGRVNHYALRSTDAFMVKWQRGFVHPNAPTVRGKGTPLDYWRLFNWNEVEETGILRQRDATLAWLEKLRSVGKVAHLEQKGLEWHQARAQNLRIAQADYFKAIKAAGASQIDDELPDFSAHGCPPVGEERYIDVVKLNRRLKESQLDQELILARLSPES